MTDPETIWVKFTQDYEVQDEKAGTAEATRFKKDQRKKLPLASAKHFIDRGKAVKYKPANRNPAKPAGKKLPKPTAEKK